MTQEAAEKARKILSEMDSLEQINDTMECECGLWWSFCTANSRKDDMKMPKVLREEFEQAVIRAKEKLQKELERL